MTRRRWAWAALILLGLGVLVLSSCRSSLPEPNTLPPVGHTTPDGPESEAKELPVETARGDSVVVEPPLDPSEPTTPRVSRVTERPTSILVRVGLATDRKEVEFTCCGPLRAEWDGKTVLTAASLRVRASPGRATPPVFRLQVAALRDVTQAQAMVARLSRLSGFSGDEVLDAESGLHKVRVGPFADREAAESARRTLSAHGVDGAWILSEGGVLEDPAVEVVSGGQSRRIRGRWLAIGAEEGRGVRVGSTRYRGRILLFLNDRGSLNVIDELSIEEYLRGVVPKELGPDLYPQLEALKAQTVAARTYTVRNLGEFADEGYDICATPRCQVYGGMEVEHPLTDRAIEETADQVLLWRDEPIDALYSATCGGHTEDVGTVFPLKSDETYLQGVPCLEHGVTNLRGSAPGESVERTVLEELIGVTDAAPQIFGQRLTRMGVLAGYTSSDTAQPLEELTGVSIRRYWRGRFPGAGDFVSFPPASESALSAKQQLDFLWRFARELGVVNVQTVGFSSLTGSKLEVRDDRGEKMRLDWTPTTVTGWKSGERVVSGNLRVAAGDALWLVHRNGKVMAVVQENSRPAAVFDRVSRWNHWERFHSDRDLRRSVAEHIPGFEFASFEALQRGVSGRVGRLRLTAVDGRQEVIEGLAVRWTLDLPDTSFTAKRTHPPGREAGWLFSGQGWGHGVGMCQIGAYGMAQRGNSYWGILSHYYSGVSLGRVSAVVRRVHQESGQVAGGV
ncbi:MAG: SpoIID/LytB domain-containing protein [Thermoanaerobaculia bacterium]|nr:SpoIID/LytB domain-containing protein [Thermoanaerobaculia bacterium]